MTLIHLRAWSSKRCNPVFCALLFIALNLSLPESLQAQYDQYKTSQSGVLESERGDGQNNNHVFSRWMYTKRLGDPLASMNSDNLFFREKRVALSTSLNLDSINRNIAHAQREGISADKLNNLLRSSTLQVVSRYRELPLEQALPGVGAVVDITNQQRQYSPKTPRGAHRFYFKQLGEEHPQVLRPNSVTQMMDADVPPPSDRDLVVYNQNFMPWDVENQSSMIAWAMEQASPLSSVAPSQVNGVILIDGLSGETRAGGRFSTGTNTSSIADFSQSGGIVVDVREIARQQGDFGVVVACLSGGRRVILKNAMLLAGPIQFVCDGHIVLVGSMGWNDKFGPIEFAQNAYPWVKPPEQTRWRVLCPNFQVCSPWSLYDLTQGNL